MWFSVLIEMWLTHDGVLGIVVVHTGGDPESAFAQEYEEFGIGVRVTRSHAGWHEFMVDRDGGCDLHINGRPQAKMALAMCRPRTKLWRGSGVFLE